MERGASQILRVFIHYLLFCKTPNRATLELNEGLLSTQWLKGVRWQHWNYTACLERIDSPAQKSTLIYKDVVCNKSSDRQLKV